MKIFFFGDQIFIGKMINDCKKTPNRIRRIPDPIHRTKKSKQNVLS